MGHKVNPTGFRLGVVKGWQSRWYAEHDYKNILAEDFLIRRAINKDLANAAVSRIEIERAASNQVLVKIHTAKPGIVIGKNGEKVDRLRAHLESQTKKRVRLEILEIRQPELDAYLVGRGIAEQLEKRVSFRRAMKQAVQKSMRANAKGIKIVIGGRLGGAEIARSEKEVEGKVPLQTLRADIDYGLTEAHTTFGVIGIKVWIYRGDILPTKRREAADIQQETAAQPFTQREERRGERGERGDRGERRGERRDFNAPRGERGQRPQGDRSQGDRPRGDRGPRPQGDRPQRPQGQGQQGERGDRPQRPQGERGDRGPRPQGDRPQRPQGQGQQGERGERVPREPRAEQAAQVTGESLTPQTTVTPVTQPEATPPTATNAPVTPPTPTTPDAPTSDTSATQGE